MVNVSRTWRNWTICAACVIAQGSPAVFANFTGEEKASVIEYWKTKAKYVAEPAMVEGREWNVRLTPAGSIWIRELYKQFQSTKVNPSRDPEGNTPEQQRWVAWLDRQVKRDWGAAELQARQLNERESDPASNPKTEPEKVSFDRKVGTDKIGRPEPNTIPQADDQCPSELVALLGPPPKFSAAVRPMKHTITFQDGMALSYVDNVKVRAKYAYYRFADGVNSEGQRMKSLDEADVNALCRQAGISGTEQKVMKAVSLLEGGFDSINTYDTGLVSVGFIQFACLGDGTGSLGKMMSFYKSSNPAGFNRDFRRYGIDVDGTKLVALDLETGQEFTGADAAAEIIHEKRLIAVFQKAGLMSTAFRVAQLQAAKNQFYPGNDLVTIKLGGQDCSVKLCDIFKTEAGLATLMDRKVNTGKIAGLKECLDRCVVDYAITKPSELPMLEYVLSRELAYRTDFTSATALAKPRNNVAELSRRGSRLDRSKKGN